MSERSVFQYLSDALLADVIGEMKIKRADATFRAERSNVAEHVNDRIALTTFYQTAVAERTARLALDPETRAALAKAGPMSAAEFVKIALGPAKRLREMADKLDGGAR